ncbi:hypothetical protein [Gallaecimonas mangrovi]|uniref:hypothetical protein n=1 Tax=Gallaecimonas mangrovi TaxID=2291597 RepID=UPI000E1FBE30|nr:hypothetical protein [Gallaecimonas mangrovi]
MPTSAPLEDITISEQHSIDHVLSEEEIAFLGQLNQPRKRRFPWGRLAFFVLLLVAAVATFIYSFDRFSVSINHGLYQHQGILYTSPPTKAVQQAAQSLPAGSIVTYFEEQWVSCSPLEDGWQCQSLPTPSS